MMFSQIVKHLKVQFAPWTNFKFQKKEEEKNPLNSKNTMFKKYKRKVTILEEKELILTKYLNNDKNRDGVRGI